LSRRRRRVWCYNKGVEKFVLKTVIPHSFSGTVCDFLAAQSGISRGIIKDAMSKGAVWMKRKNRGRLVRVRSATVPLFAGDHIEFYYDERLLAAKPPVARCINDQGRYSVWHKPAGLLAQGTMFGDHCSLLRQAELFFKPSREVFLVHRLDRETDGIMLIAHDAGAAARLSELFREKTIIKKYRAVVRGYLRAKGEKGVIRLPLDGRPAVTEFAVGSYDASSDTTAVNIIISTGRLHQIRRHFDMIGFPVMGDPKYGKGNKNTEGMKLLALSLRFRCPFTGRDVEYHSSDM
jgi:tRNA pseudouridine32 synthase/23S rRNA pseudouridine746 synthase